MSISSSLTCKEGMTPACAASQVFCFGITLAGFVLLAIAIPTRRRAASCNPRPWWQLCMEERKEFRKKHGNRVFWGIHLVGFGCFPCFWLDSADHGQFYAVSAREAYSRIWLCARWFFSLSGIALGIAAILLLIDDTEYATNIETVSLFTSAVLCTVSQGLATKKNRMRFSAFLMQVAFTKEEREAVVIAKLVTDGGSIDTLTSNAQQMFRVIPWPLVNNMMHWDTAIASTSKVKNCNFMETGLYAATQPAEMGECDAFLSHSWHDNAQSKLRALSAWASEFEHRNGRTPSVWLDKACINQQDIKNSLECLPIFLSACQRLVICIGPTYAQRLWCVMELFIFIKMGGSVDCVDVLPIEDSREEALERISQFDAQEAKCFVPDDRQRLLAIIESGFGNFDVFNSLVRQMLTSVVEKNSRSSAGNVQNSMGA
eukprot:gnl/MRDRNA2_/MRDRNA2_86275_c0_seq2.p1 gnl/MRDRNA2_/MRDRNA2_86275_c0~~gnl/MRDRNA2_/MRDRNA2_86275_c0_seq2.p1  ORF type:complete len:495 (+),score=55.37 gnl/MRDRNA2_/MRDRNA2_86275_c0_seq2:197-1486(+)